MGTLCNVCSVNGGHSGSSALIDCSSSSDGLLQQQHHIDAPRTGSRQRRILGLTSLLSVRQTPTALCCLGSQNLTCFMAVGSVSLHRNAHAQHHL
eukprot:9392-Heterococcus_DN1.PRE.3